MKLVLVRHGKSDWHTSADDFNRPLNKRGLRDAPRMAAELQNRGITPDIILTSPAVRALTTARLMADTFNLKDVKEIPSLYLASLQEILQEVFQPRSEDDTIFLFGHNPGISMTASYLRQKETSMPTCSAAVIDLEREDDEWRVTSSLFLKPKDI